MACWSGESGAGAAGATGGGGPGGTAGIVSGGGGSSRCCTPITGVPVYRWAVSGEAVRWNAAKASRRSPASRAVGSAPGSRPAIIAASWSADSVPLGPTGRSYGIASAPRLAKRKRSSGESSAGAVCGCAGGTPATSACVGTIRRPRISIISGVASVSVGPTERTSPSVGTARVGMRARTSGLISPGRAVVRSWSIICIARRVCSGEALSSVPTNDIMMASRFPGTTA